MNIKARLSIYRYRLPYFIAFTCLGAFLFVSRVEAQTWEFKLTPSKENLCTVNGQSAGIPISVNPGDEVIVQVRNNSSTRHLLRWRGVIYHGEQGTAVTTQAASRRFYSLQRAVGTGETFTYRWKMESKGTLVYDCRIAAEQAI